MGFCLFQQSQDERLYYAVNAFHIQAIEPLPEAKAGHDPLCRIVWQPDCKVKKFEKGLVVKGDVNELQKLWASAAKIGLNKLEILTIGSGRTKAPMPTLMNNPGRIVVVSELAPDGLVQADGEFSTASFVAFSDGTTRMIVERPGVFASRANAGSIVPMLP